MPPDPDRMLRRALSRLVWVGGVAALALWLGQYLTGEPQGLLVLGAVLVTLVAPVHGRS